MKTDDSLDIVILIFLIAAILSVGLSALVKERDRTTAYMSQYVNDKNTKQNLITQDVFSESTYGEYTLDEVYLSLQIQNYYMQKPKRLAVSYVSTGQDGLASGTEVVLGPLDVTTLHESDRDVYCEFLTGFVDNYMLKGQSTADNRDNLRFTLELDNGDDLTTEEDDFYVFRKVER